MWNIQTKVKNKKLKQAKLSIAEAKLMIDFYQFLKENSEMDEQEKAKVELKISSMQDAIEFNEAFITFVK